ncbi:response regulator [Waltera sp.]|uniref:response regulator n=1 Tax=Waltera sp. TaxID=2815806 RepID=UPI003AB9674B
MNLLIVDDEYLVVEEVVTVTDWELLGITEIYSATNAVSAVRILNEKKIDIMICDIEMPQTDGLELSKKAKENFPDLEIVMLTSHAEFNYVRNALRYGCYDYIHFLRREMLDFTAFPVFFVSNLLLVQRKKYYFNRAMVSRNCSIVL